jgi:zinc transport system substrate-binding protein
VCVVWQPRLTATKVSSPGRDSKDFPARPLPPIISGLMRTSLPLLILLVLAAGCEAVGDPVEEPGSLAVAASLHPIASVVREVGGGDVTVRTLLPPGTHPDSYDATPRMAEVLAGADLVVRVGGAVDGWLESRGRATQVVLTDGMTLRGSDHDHDHGPGARGTRGTGNPHVWLDPILVRDTLLPAIVEALTRHAPDAAPAFRQRAAAFADSLTALDAEIRNLLEGARVRAFVSAHPAWVYFADRYGLEEIGSLHPSPGRELGARELAGLVTRARAAGGAAVIAEPQLGRAGVDALARELGVRVEVADPVGGEGVEGRGDYLSLMRYNARAFARALGATGA